MLLTYRYCPGIDRPHSMQEWANGVKGQQHFYALDLPGSNVRGLFYAPSATNTVVSHKYSYGPFGEAQGASGSSGQPLRFAARELDATTGLYYVRARWYDAGMGRFISEDPIGLEGGINNYAYALNDPVNLSDPTGLCTAGAWVIISNFHDITEPCTGGLLGLSFLIDRWSGIRNGDGVAHTMSGVAFATSAGWQDGAGVKARPDEPDPDCGKLVGQAFVSAIGDGLFLAGVGGAYRGLKATRQVVRIARQKPVESVLVTDARRNAARVRLGIEVGKAVVGVGHQVATAYVAGDSWTYAIPLWGTGRRSWEAIQCIRRN